VRKLRNLGFDGPYGGGKHVFMRHPQTGVKISVPIHKGRNIAVGTLWAILPVGYLSGGVEQAIGIGTRSGKGRTLVAFLSVNGWGKDKLMGTRSELMGALRPALCGLRLSPICKTGAVWYNCACNPESGRVRDLAIDPCISEGSIP